jgi:hypothetical protein
MLMGAVTEVTVVARGPSQNRSLLRRCPVSERRRTARAVGFEAVGTDDENHGVKSETGGDSAVATAEIPHPRIARETVLSVQKLLRVYEPPISSILEDRQPVVHVLWGWWKYLVDQAELVVREAHGRRFATTAPLVRSIGEHADLMLWLADAGPDGITALHAADQNAQQKLWDSYQRSEGHPPDGVPRPPDPVPMRSTRGEQALSGLRSVEQRMGSAEGGVPYYIYRLLSGLTHGGLNTSRVYAPVAENGSGRFLNRAHKPVMEALADAPVLDVAIRCVQASLIFQREVHDSRLDNKVTRWCHDMHMSGELPTFAPPKDSPVTAEDVAISARRVLIMGLEPASRVLETLVADGLPTDVDPARVLKTLGRLEGSTRALTALYPEAR